MLFIFGSIRSIVFFCRDGTQTERAIAVFQTSHCIALLSFGLKEFIFFAPVLADLNSRLGFGGTESNHAVPLFCFALLLAWPSPPSTLGDALNTLAAGTFVFF